MKGKLDSGGRKRGGIWGHELQGRSELIVCSITIGFCLDGIYINGGL